MWRWGCSRGEMAACRGKLPHQAWKGRAVNIRACDWMHGNRRWSWGPHKSRPPASSPLGRGAVHLPLSTSFFFNACPSILGTPPDFSRHIGGRATRAPPTCGTPPPCAPLRAVGGPGPAPWLPAVGRPPCWGQQRPAPGLAALGQGGGVHGGGQGGGCDGAEGMRGGGSAQHAALQPWDKGGRCTAGGRVEAVVGQRACVGAAAPSTRPRSPGTQGSVHSMGGPMGALHAAHRTALSMRRVL